MCEPLLALEQVWQELHLRGHVESFEEPEKKFDQSRIQRKVDCYLWKEKKPTCQDLAATPGPPCPRVEEPLG